MPEIVHKVQSLTIYQRTPGWVIPMDNKPFDEKKLQEFEDPAKLRAYRQQLMDQVRSFFSVFSSVISGVWIMASSPASSSAFGLERLLELHLPISELD